MTGDLDRPLRMTDIQSQKQIPWIVGSERVSPPHKGPVVRVCHIDDSHGVGCPQGETSAGQCSKFKHLRIFLLMSDDSLLFVSPFLFLRAREGSQGPQILS